MRENKLICSRNKYGYRGVRMREDGRGKPFYARIRISDRQIIDSAHYKTAREAAAAFDRMDFWRRRSRCSHGGIR